MSAARREEEGCATAADSGTTKKAIGTSRSPRGYAVRIQWEFVVAARSARGEFRIAAAMDIMMRPDESQGQEWAASGWQVREAGKGK